MFFDIISRLGIRLFACNLIGFFATILHHGQFHFVSAIITKQAHYIVFVVFWGGY